MNAAATKRDRLIQWMALAWLLILGTLALAGPYGMLAWGEKSALLDSRQVSISALQEQRSVLENRVALLDPDNVDPDFASELVRHNLNVAHRDEYVIDLGTQP